MKFAILAFATLLAQAVAQAYNVQSDGFRLVLKSPTNNSAYNNHALGPCHVGAAEESLCLTNDTIIDPPRYATTFYHNTTSYNHDNPKNANDTAGILNWPLRYNNGEGIASSAMAFQYSATPYLMSMIFAPGKASHQNVYFEQRNSSYSTMYIIVSLNDTGSTPAFSVPAIKVSNWYICTKYLMWNMGLTNEPLDSSCSKVSVQRVWA
ncbi:unnamed protein product [Alternaria alternata]|uniref:DUF7907 domain-containing protein n=1 Tax=Alternaria tenuissima TaxID=119927 RepID=A0A4Q4PSY5_9PLEO|nr:hypothetical protein AA0115_g10034 [Alternaria tenuissima]RYN63247.1 hypothetical protein AA0118_g4917 [Alternaria tenuissima]RYN96100.1 hypothetical protein AA0120_g2980 [Alternaria tenuissima]RYO08007.1 hypothetical protein AA0119_g1574 [Alternaria tenuissima]RYO23377.1 hypothetical protein AA0121_g1673 [Alternaria tenuissima]